VRTEILSFMTRNGRRIPHPKRLRLDPVHLQGQQ
jgi:hypothetical protein